LNHEGMVNCRGRVVNWHLDDGGGLSVPMERPRP
jgi:hypothetical protein